ncbi:MAG TPA: lipopolysaccharide heptosyltransferase II [Planctomycetaceae bacterium]|nr:lipopolysaccharide heptosyltransferase II [Planctomycetaceae bacterium]
MKLAVFLPNWIGDAVMATPALAALRRRFGCGIVAVGRSYVADVLAGSKLVDRLMVSDGGGLFSGRARQLVNDLRRERFDLAVLFPNSFRTAAIARLARIRRRVGFARDGRGWLLTDRLRPRSRREPNPVLDEYLRLAEYLDCDVTSREMHLATTTDDERALAAFWRAQPAGPPGCGVVCLNPGGAYGSAKHWPMKSFAELARRLAVERERTVLVLCGPAEREEAWTIAARAGHSRVVSLADAPPSIGLTKAAIRHCDLLVTTDSGPRHFAPPFRVPVVTLFGPTHIGWSETFYEKAVHLQVDLDCGPCQQRTCPLGHHRCMRELSVERVYAAAARLLDRYGTPPAVDREPLRVAS